MAIHLPSPKHTNWWLWGGGGLALIIALGLLLYGFDFFGLGLNDAIPPSLTTPE
jgi:hypothetical protein